MTLTAAIGHLATVTWLLVIASLFMQVLSLGMKGEKVKQLAVLACVFTIAYFIARSQ